MQRELPIWSDIEIDQSRLQCPYLPDREACLVYWLPTQSRPHMDLDRRLAAGQRRHGLLVYQPSCQDCRECISLRVPVARFQPGRGQRRVRLRGDRELTVQTGKPQIDQRRLDLLNEHSRWRGWMDQEEVTESFYEQIFICSTFDTFEIDYYLGNRLVGVAICDLGERGVSAVYTYYDPAVARYSLGTYSVLYQIDWAHRQGLDFLYLGYYVADCRSLSYKANFQPHQRLIDGHWRDIPWQP